MLELGISNKKIIGGGGCKITILRRISKILHVLRYHATLSVINTFLYPTLDTPVVCNKGLSSLSSFLKFLSMLSLSLVHLIGLPFILTMTHDKRIES